MTSADTQPVDVAADIAMAVPPPPPPSPPSPPQDHNGIAVGTVSPSATSISQVGQPLQPPAPSQLTLDGHADTLATRVIELAARVASLRDVIRGLDQLRLNRCESRDLLSSTIVQYHINAINADITKLNGLLSNLESVFGLPAFSRLAVVSLQVPPSLLPSSLHSVTSQLMNIGSRMREVYEILSDLPNCALADTNVDAALAILSVLLRHLGGIDVLSESLHRRVADNVDRLLPPAIVSDAPSPTMNPERSFDAIVDLEERRMVEKLVSWWGSLARWLMSWVRCMMLTQITLHPPQILIRRRGMC